MGCNNIGKCTICGGAGRVANVFRIISDRRGYIQVVLLISRLAGGNIA